MSSSRAILKLVLLENGLLTIEVHVLLHICVLDSAAKNLVSETEKEQQANHYRYDSCDLDCLRMLLGGLLRSRWPQVFIVSVNLAILQESSKIMLD